MQHKSSNKNRKCFVSKLATWQVDNIRRQVCQDLPAEYEHENNFYCLLHYPNEKTSDCIYYDGIGRRTYAFDVANYG